MVTDRMQSHLNRLGTGRKLGRELRVEVPEDRNALALHYIESGAIQRFSAGHRIIVKTA
jgi:hypothetical protein